MKKIKFRIIFDFGDLCPDTITLKDVTEVLNFFNNSRTEAFIKRRNDDLIDIVISKSDSLENLLDKTKVKHFDNFEDYRRWLDGQNRKKD